MVDERVKRVAAAASGGAVGLVLGGTGGATVGAVAAERAANHLLKGRTLDNDGEGTDGANKGKKRQ